MKNIILKSCEHADRHQYKDISTQRLNLLILPTQTEISNIELDITLNCNLRCRYCYKGKAKNINMSKQVAFDAIIWLIYASGLRKHLGVFLMGGEPLINFSLIKLLFPFGITRAKQHGKSLNFGMTTNCTMVTDEVIEFFQKWGGMFHTSLDGVPDIQNKNRPTSTGEHSSYLAEIGAKKILAYQPNVAVRCTYDAENVHFLFENYLYFRDLGYLNIIMIPAFSATWVESALDILEINYLRIADYWMNEFRNGKIVYFKQFQDYFFSHNKSKRGLVPCSAGRGYGMINANGDYYPCTRWGTHDRSLWSFGNIYEGFHEEMRNEFLKGFPENSFFPECDICEARCLCNGGCLAENLDTTSNAYTVIPISCKIMKIWVKTGKYIHATMLKENNILFLNMYYQENIPQSTTNRTPEECKF
jgi:uncharacterized protein